MKQTYIHFLFLTVIIISSCKKYSYYQNNPNQTTKATPALLLTNICINAISYNFNSTGSAFAAREVTTYGTSNDYVNYGWIQGSYGNYDLLRQVQEMNSLAVTAGQPAYTGLAHFFNAVLFSQLTETFGDIPYTQALQAAGNNTTPVYDKQEDIYVGILNELEQANTIMAQVAAKGTPVIGDIIYGGSAAKWQKAINAFRLRLLIHLSKKTGDTKLNVAQQFKTIISDPTTHPLMDGNADNAQIVYNTSAVSNYYPSYNYLPTLTATSLEQGIADTLISKKDPRLFVIAQPMSGKAAGNFASYIGINAGLTATDQQNAANTASLLAARYSTSMVNEPIMLIGYPEQEFLIAEAISRGWISAGPGGNIGSTAQDCYNNGITGSMQFYNTFAAAGISDQAISNYLTQTTVAYNSSIAIQQIITQKYLALFLQSGFEPFFEQRRTGYPTFNVGAGTLNNGKIPKRWAYPVNEYVQNEKNVTAAVQSQYAGKDDVNGVMWLLQ